jgi:hypothetical protein
MAKDTTPEEANAIHTLGAIPAREIASKWIRSGDYRKSNRRFLESVKACLDIVEAGVSIPALEVNRFLAGSTFGNHTASDWEKISDEIEAEILGYAIEAHEPETLALFKSLLA